MGGGDYTGTEILPGEWVVQVTYWGEPQTWGLTPGRWVPLGGLKTSGSNRRAVGNLDSTLKKHAHACLLTPGNKEEEADWNCSGLWLVSHDRSTHPSPHWAPAPAALAPAQLLTRAKVAIAKNSAAVGDGAGTDLALHLNGARITITGTCGGSKSGVNSDWSARTT